MTIQNFPAILQPIIQQGFLEREFQQAVTTRNTFRACADRVETPVGINDIATIEGIPIEINHYAATCDLNMVTSRVGIASQFLQNAYANGEQSARSLNELAFMALRRQFEADKNATIRAENRVPENAYLTMGLLLDAAAQLRINKTPEIDGAYNCYLDPVSARQLFADPDFKGLFQGATSASQVFRKGMTNDFLGIRFMPVSEAFIERHPTLPNVVIRRPIICGAGALIEADYSGMLGEDVRPGDALVSLIEDIAMVTREPVDRLQQIIAQSWYWIGGFGARSGRAILLEHVG